MSKTPLLPVAEAQRRIVDAMPLMPAEQIPVSAGLGRVLAQDLASRRSQPPTPVSAMDGYAVRASDVANVPTRLRIIGYAPAGHPYEGLVGPGQAVRIFTGAPMPRGSDTIVIQEDTVKEQDTVSVQSSASPGRYVRPAGLDFKEGEILMTAGRILTARDIGLVAAMNIPWVRVRRKPRIAILATGDEIVMPGDPVGHAQIVSSNALSLGAFVQAHGGEAIDLGIAPDEVDGLKRLAEGARGSDLLVTTGGASVGDHDLVQEVLGDIGLEVDFWRIAMRPGKPLIFGSLGETWLVGLPGNPVSSLVCAIMFLAPAIRKLLGTDNVLPQRQTARLGAELPENDEREDYLRATLFCEDQIVTPFARQDSSMFATMASADALIVRKPHAPAARMDDEVEIILLDDSIYSI